MTAEPIIEIEEEDGTFVTLAEIKEIDWSGVTPADLGLLPVPQSKSTFIVDFPLPFELPPVGVWVPLRVQLDGDDVLLQGEGMVTGARSYDGDGEHVFLRVRGMEVVDDC